MLVPVKIKFHVYRLRCICGHSYGISSHGFQNPIFLSAFCCFVSVYSDINSAYSGNESEFFNLKSKHTEQKIRTNKILFWIEMSKNNNIDLSVIWYSQLIL